jgi:tetratricopeptide (TPR) repeat protein
MKRFLFLTTFLICGCKYPTNSTKPASHYSNSETIEAITLFGDTLKTPKVVSGKMFDNYKKAKKQFEDLPNSVEAIIWYGRRTAYLGHFKNAISIYTEGIKKFPEEARLYRHRGHRYITTRSYDKAIEDFKTAAKLMKDKPNQIEPDGLPNAKNIPISTLKGNIWYHLGLAYYLKGDFENALWAYRQRDAVNTNNDNIVSEGHWLYMILKRMGRDNEAKTEIESITLDLDIIENVNYHKMCLFYKGLLKIKDLKIMGDGSSSDDVFLYGIGNWYLYQKNDTTKAKKYFKRLLESGNPFSFAYLAAESDWEQLFKRP